MIARHGPLREAVGLSLCLPILAPPQARGRELFIDGSLVDNLPVRALAEMGEGPIIAVDVKATFERSSRDGRSPRAPNGGDPQRPPSLGETLARVLLLGSENISEAARRHADLVIKPRPHGVGLLGFHQLDAAREAGRVAAREALEQAPPGYSPEGDVQLAPLSGGECSCLSKWPWPGRCMVETILLCPLVA